MGFQKAHTPSHTLPQTWGKHNSSPVLLLTCLNLSGCSGYQANTKSHMEPVNVAQPSLPLSKSTNSRGGTGRSSFRLGGGHQLVRGNGEMEKECVTLMGHTLALNNNPEEEPPWVAQVVKGTEKGNITYTNTDPLPEKHFTPKQRKSHILS